MTGFLPKLSQEQIFGLQEIVSKSKNATQVKMAQAIVLVDKGKSSSDIKMITGIGRSWAFRLRKSFLERGISSLDVKPRGIKELLTKSQLTEIVELVKFKSPKEAGVSAHHDFWNTGVLARMVADRYGVVFKSKTSYYLIFRKATFTYHKPGHVYQKHDPQKVSDWRKEITPKIEKAWNDPDTVILCEDEMKLTTQTTFQKIWLPKGEYPRVLILNKKEGRSIYGFLNVKTGSQHAFKTNWQNMYITKDQLVKIRKIYPTQNLLILWDGPGSHRGHIVTDFVKEDGNIKIIYFPPYSPQENPQEHVWKEGRSKITHNKFIEDIDKATDQFVDYLNNKIFPYKLLNFSPL